MSLKWNESKMNSGMEFLCRICLEDGATVPIFENCLRDDGSNPNPQNQLTICLNEKLEDVAGYPRNICDSCQVTLNTVYTFINKYKESCRILQKRLQLVVKQENEDYNDFVYSEDDIFESKSMKRNIKIEFEDGAHFITKIKPLCNLEISGVKINTQVKMKSKKDTPVKKKSKKDTLIKNKTIKKLYTNSNCKNKTNRITTALLERNYYWNGENWCPAAPSSKPTTKEIVHIKTAVNNESDKLQHLPKPENKLTDPVLCESCGETFKNREKLKLHEDRKHKNLTVTCPTCKVTVNCSNSLKRHMKRIHSGIKEFICSKCGKGFAFKKDLSTHNKQVHEKPEVTVIRRVPCKLCDRDFANKINLLTHVRAAHTGERPAQCSVCDASFYHETYLKQHMRLHTGECPYKCPVCGRGYSQSCNMKSHMRNHRISDLDKETLSKIKPSWYKFMKP